MHNSCFIALDISYSKPLCRLCHANLVSKETVIDLKELLNLVDVDCNWFTVKVDIFVNHKVDIVLTMTTCRYVYVQKMQLDMILTSLQDNGHVAVLLGFARPMEPVTSGNSSSGAGAAAVPQSTIQLAEMLMKTLLRNIAFHSVSCWHFIAFTFVVRNLSQER